MPFNYPQMFTSSRFVPCLSPPSAPMRNTRNYVFQGLTLSLQIKGLWSMEVQLG